MTGSADPVIASGDPVDGSAGPVSMPDNASDPVTGVDAPVVAAGDPVDGSAGPVSEPSVREAAGHPDQPAEGVTVRTKARQAADSFAVPSASPAGVREADTTAKKSALNF